MHTINDQTAYLSLQQAISVLLGSISQQPIHSLDHTIRSIQPKYSQTQVS